MAVITWQEFRSRQPQMADAGTALLYEVGVGLGYLATTRPDGAPRLHPMCPIVTEEGLYGFIVPSPKQRDLHRDGRFALHSIPLETNEDAFYVTGRARHIQAVELRKRIGDQFVAERAMLNVSAPGPDQHLFEFLIATAMLTRTTGHGDPTPVHTVWHAG